MTGIRPMGYMKVFFRDGELLVLLGDSVCPYRFYGISTFVGYLIPYLFLYKKSSISKNSV